MRICFFKILIIFIISTTSISVFSQDNIKKSPTTENILDSLRKSGVKFGSLKRKPEVILSRKQALDYLQKKIHPQLWHNPNDPLREAFGQLIFEAAHSPLDSLKNTLMNYPYDSLSVSWDKFYIWEPLRIKIPDLHKSSDSSMFAKSEVMDSIRKQITEDIARAGKFKDTTFLVIIDSLKKVPSPRPGFPFRYADFPFEGDSIRAAVGTLFNYIEKRDSSVFKFTGIGKSVTPIVINSGSQRFMRYWLKNEFSDSVTVWIGNPDRNTIGLYLEQGVNFRRPSRQGDYGKPKIDVQHPDSKSLIDLQNLKIKPKLWKFRSETSFVLNQSSMSNWVKGGEGSISTALDATGYAEYNNKDKKISTLNFARLKFGYIATQKDGLIKNLDLLETNSKFNHLAFGKVDFSAILLFKTQVANGWNYYTNDSGAVSRNLVSKFMSPGVLTVGLGFDYKPNKKTSINFSPLSYKGTFVTDTARIDQTQYGIAANKKSLNEPGASLMISHEFNPMKTITVLNRLQLFTNYINKPQNVDVDWEMIMTAHLNWFTEVRFNTHLIFDDDTRTSRKYRNGQPVLESDGTEKKSARIQFKEMLGFSVSFKF